MLILLFTIICIISVVCSVALGNIEQIGYCVIQGANEAVQLSLVLMGVMTLWSGIMRVLSASGTIRALTALLSPVLRILYPDASKKITD